MYAKRSRLFESLRNSKIGLGVPSDETWIDSKLYTPGPGGLN